MTTGSLIVAIKLHLPGTAALFVGATSRTGRDRRCAVAVHQRGYTLKAVAEFLGLHYATVSRALAWAEAQRRSHAHVAFQDLTPVSLPYPRRGRLSGSVTFSKSVTTAGVPAHAGAGVIMPVTCPWSLTLGCGCQALLAVATCTRQM